MTGYTIFESTDQRYLMHLGHPEYEPERLVYEYQRDLEAGRTDVEPPANVDVENPVNTWRSHRNEFYSQWLKFIYDTVSFGSWPLVHASSMRPSPHATAPSGELADLAQISPGNH
jgi:homoserine O-succinyltransferase